VDPPADAAARLENSYLGAAARQRFRRRQAGEAGADDDDSTVGQAQRGSAR